MDPYELIEIKGLKKRYTKDGPLILKGIDLTINKGEFVAITGRSGSGKTTLLNIIGALDLNFEGSVVVDGLVLQNASDGLLSEYRNKTIGFVFQAFHLIPHITCLENVLLPAMVSTGATQSKRQRAMNLMQELDIADKMDAYPSALSAGERQRVAIARALLQDPKILLCDEPTGNLDPVTARDVLDIFVRLNKEQGRTVVLITHNRDVAAVAHRELQMVDGVLKEGK